MMRRKTIFLTVLAAFFAVVLFSAPIFAAGGCQCGGDCFIGQIPDLTDAQKAQIQKLNLEFRKKMISMKAELAKQELDMKALLMEDAGEKPLNLKIDEIHKLKAQIQKECYANFRALRNLLNDEQKKSIALKFCHMNCGGNCGHEAKQGCGHSWGKKACCGGQSHCCAQQKGHSEGCCNKSQGCQQKSACQAAPQGCSQKSTCAAAKAGKCGGSDQ